MYWILQRVQAWSGSKRYRKMKTEICFDCYRIMAEKEETVDNDHRVFWVCESCGKRKYNDHDQLKIN
jgi:RNase P subunit RPR2